MSTRPYMKSDILFYNLGKLNLKKRFADASQGTYQSLISLSSSIFKFEKDTKWAQY